MSTLNRDAMLRLLRECSEQKATELHFKVPNRPLMRMPDGALVPTRHNQLVPSDTTAAVFALCALARIELPVAQLRDHEFSFGINGLGRYQALIYRQRGTLGAVVRRVNTSIPTLEALGVPDEVEAKVGEPGLILIAGQHRTEVLHALVSSFNGRSRAHVVIVETPLTYLHRDAMSAISHREVGIDVPQYEAGLEQAVRIGADLVALGNVPDATTADRLLWAAERQLPVIAAVAAPTAAEATWWLTRMFYGEQRADTERRLDAVLRAVVSASPGETPDVKWLYPDPS